MVFDWNEYLVIAEKLKIDTDRQSAGAFSEAKQRTAISRAYYAVYHLAETYAKAKLGYVPNQYGRNQYHTDVRGVYRGQMGNPDHQEVGKMLARLHKARIDCDYKEAGLGNIQHLLTSVLIDANNIKTILSD